MRNETDRGRELVQIAHGIKTYSGESIRSGGYEDFVYKKRWTAVGGRTIAEALRSKKGTRNESIEQNSQVDLDIRRENINGLISSLNGNYG